MARSRQGGADIVDDELPFGLSGRALMFATGRDSRHDVVEPAVGGQGHRESLPACNRPFDRRERASEQHAGGKDDGGTSALVEHEPGGSAHDQDLRQRPRGFGDQHDGLVAALHHGLLASRILRCLADEARSAVEHSHRPDHVEVSGGHGEPVPGSSSVRQPTAPAGLP